MKELHQIDSMPLKALLVCETLDDIKSVLKKYEYSNLWFRGVEKASYRLTPGLHRNAELISDEFGRYINPSSFRSGGATRSIFPNPWKLLSDFRNEVRTRKLIDIENMSDIDWLYIAQHYGLPTPLLDWTESIEVALWFAVSDELPVITECEPIERRYSTIELSEDLSAIYIINPCKFNELVEVIDGLKDIINPDEYGDFLVEHYLKEVELPFPVCICGKQIDKRLINQRGNFTMSGYQLEEIDYIGEFRKNITKILIPRSLRREALQLLNAKGINEEFIYGGYNGKDTVSKEIKDLALKVLKEESEEIRRELKAEDQDGYWKKDY